MSQYDRKYNVVIQMKSLLILKKFFLEGKEFVKAEEIKQYCNFLNLNYNYVINYFISRGYLLRIFRGIFYIKTLDELKFNTCKYSYLELVSRGLELKGINNWYFSLYTALKLNNATHEYYSMDYVISENLYRSKSISIDNRNFKFLKLKPTLLKFGIIENKIRYSDLEKTVLDFIYLWIYNKKSKKKILMDVSEYLPNLIKQKISDYGEKYPNSVKNIIKEMF